MVQDVFVRLIKRGNASELERSNLSAYVFETASSVLTDHLRKKITHRDHLYEPFDQNRHGEKDFSPEHVLIYRQQLEFTSAMLLELPEETRSRSEEHTSELQSLMRISYAVFCLKKKNKSTTQNLISQITNK